MVRIAYFPIATREKWQREMRLPIIGIAMGRGPNFHHLHPGDAVSKNP
jgi:hypothetical protein